MSDKGYTYTTINGGPGEPMNITVSFYLDDRARIHLAGTGNGRPVLDRLCRAPAESDRSQAQLVRAVCIVVRLGAGGDRDASASAALA